MAPESIVCALRHLWLALVPLKIPMALMGGLALATWKHPRATKDIDLLVGAAADDVQPLLIALQQAGIRPKRTSESIPLGRLELFEMRYEPPEAFLEIEIDLLLARSEYHRKALERCVPVNLRDLDIEVAVLACEDLILHKLLAGRAIDLADVVALLRLNRSTLDFAYLAHWGGDLRVAPGLAQTWETAWPGEALPN